MPARPIWSAIRCGIRCWRCASRPYPLLEEDGIFRVLVTGGSQGASVLSQVVPNGLSLLPVSFRRRLQVTHQARIEDIEAARAKYAELSIAADLATYLPDLPEQLAWAHLVIARAGASTLAELTAAGRPAILVPLPSATDDHQTANATRDDGGGRRADDRPAQPSRRVELAKQMQKLGLDPAALAECGRRARAAVGGPMPRATSPIWSRASIDAPEDCRSACARRTGKAQWKAALTHEGCRHRYRHDPFRRHRRDRHVAASPR